MRQWLRYMAMLHRRIAILFYFNFVLLEIWNRFLPWLRGVMRFGKLVSKGTP